jgi:hypothetical protein
LDILLDYSIDLLRRGHVFFVDEYNDLKRKTSFDMGSFYIFSSPTPSPVIQKALMIFIESFLIVSIPFSNH